MGVILLVSLLVNAHLEVLALGAEHLELGQQRSSVASLGVSKLLGVLQLGGQGYLVLAEVADGILSLLNLPGQILGLHLQLLPGGVSLIEGTSMLIQLGVGLNDESLRHLAVPLHVGTLPHGFIETSTGVHQITLHGGLVLLGLGLVLVERVNVVSHLAHGVVVLGPHGGKGALVLDVGLLQLHLQLGQLGLALLVQLNLGASVGPRLIKTTAQVLDVTGQNGPVLLSLGPGLSLNDKLLIQLINASLQLLDLLGVLAAKSVLVLNLGADRCKLLLLPHESLLELGPDTLKVRDSLLGQLEVSLNLPLHLLNISLALLLTLKSILAFIQSLLKLPLDLGKMVALVLHGLNVLLSLLPSLSSSLLLLLEFTNQFLLVGNLLPQGSDLVVLGVLVILCLLAVRLKILDLLSEAVGIRGDLDTGLTDAVDEVLLSLDTLVDIIQLLLDIVLLGLHAVGLVNDVLDHGSSRGKSHVELVLLSHKAVMDSDHSVALGDGLVNVGLGQLNLVLVLLLVLAELGALEVGLDEEPDLHPLPGLGNQHVPDGPLATVESKLLVLQLLESNTAGLASGSRLQPGKDGSNLVLTDLLHVTEDTGSEEDLGVTKTELLLVKLDGVHDGSSSSSLVILGLGHHLGGKDVVSSLELRVQHFVGETLAADGDTGQHTIALVLVHDEVGLDTSGLLVGVGHHTTDEVGLGLVEGGHQVIKLTLEVGGHSLAASLLLPVRGILGSLQGLARVVSEALDSKRVATVLDHLDNGVIERILVLLEPSSQVVGDSGSIMDDGKVRIRVRA